MLPHGQITRLKKLQLPKIYPITNVELAGVSHAEQIRALAEAGCRFAQIREKSAATRVIYEEVLNALEIANAHGLKLIVNDRVDVAIAAKAHGVHLGQDDLPPAEARKLLGGDAIIGYSTHSVEQAVLASNMPIDYLAIGPVFATTTKENPDPVVGLDGIRQVRDAIGDLPLVAIGGIGINNLAEVLAAGAGSVAIVSDLFAPGFSLRERYKMLLSAASV